MIKIFRLIRFDLMTKNKTSRYIKYAIGEIVLVVVGILIAVQINSWYSQLKEDQLKVVYTENLINDLTKDTIQLNARIKENKDTYFLKNVDSIIEIIERPNTTAEDLKRLAKSRPLTGLRIVNRYNVNTFNILISTGDIRLFEDDLVQKIMELNRLQNFEILVSEGNSNSYFNMYNSYLKEYVASTRTNSSLTDAIWDQRNALDHAPIYINTINIQKHCITRYIELSEEVVQKTEALLDLLKTK